MSGGRRKEDLPVDLSTALELFERVRQGYSLEEFLNHDDLLEDLAAAIEQRGLQCSGEEVLRPLFTERRREAGLPETTHEFAHSALDDELRREVDALAVRFREEHNDKTIESLLIDPLTRTELTLALRSIGVPEKLLPTARRAAQNVTKTKARLAAAKAYAAQGGGRPSPSLQPLPAPDPGLSVLDSELAAISAKAPAIVETARRVLAEMKARDGQSVFRSNVLALYGSRCAVSGCSTAAALQAAHIEPFDGAHTHRISNGLPLRADLHNLFDADLLGINPDTKRIHLHPEITKAGDYADIDGVVLAAPLHAAANPEEGALRERWKRFNARRNASLGT